MSSLKTSTPKHIGIVACSAEGAALCYKTIVNVSTTILGEHTHPEISMHTQNLADYVHCLNAGDMHGIGNLMIDSARKLHAIGADFCVCPDNTLHQAFAYVQTHSPVPWLHIADSVVAEAKLQGYQTLGLLGTQWLVESDVYPEKITAAGLKYQRPQSAHIEKMGHLIMSELINGEFRADTIEFFQMVITDLQQSGCDAVVLGCTEIPLIINDGNSTLPTLDSTRLLAKAAVDSAITGKR